MEERWKRKIFFRESIVEFESFSHVTSVGDPGLVARMMLAHHFFLLLFFFVMEDGVKHLLYEDMSGTMSNILSVYCHKCCLRVGGCLLS